MTEYSFGTPGNMAQALTGKKQEEPQSSERITRDAFLYMEPKGPNKEQFAQCGTCIHRREGRCTIMGQKKVNLKDGTCALYIEGDPDYHGTEADYTPDEIGYTERQVRCENCRYGGPTCKLYEALNQAFPKAFNLETKIDEYGCCNANSP